MTSTDKKLTIMQVGAFDGELSDPLKLVIQNSQHRVFLIEPQPKAYEILAKKYQRQSNVRVVNVAISDHDASLAMYLPQGEALSPKATLDRNHLKNFGGGSSGYEEIQVKSMTVETLLRGHNIEQLDALQIDAEGHDFKILLEFFSAGVEPRLINLETIHLAKNERVSLRRELENRGYGSIDYGIDMLAIKS